MIYTRSSWGGSLSAPGNPTAGAKLLVVIHHAYRPHRDCGATKSREMADVLAMHRYHGEKGWGGIGYNFCAFQSGNAYEGRGWRRTGAHTVGRNSSSVGIVLVIDGTTHKPTEALIECVESIIAEGVLLGHISPNHERAPHDRFQQKDCPGALVKATPLLRGVIPTVERADAVSAMPTLREGKGGINAPADIREAVRELQRRLGMPDQHRTGYFGALTKAAVIAFQRRNGLLDDGVVARITWGALGA